MREFFRPNCGRTPGILTSTLQTGGRPAFAARLVLAATLERATGSTGPRSSSVKNRAKSRGQRSTSTPRSTRSAAGTATAPTACAS